MAGAASQAARKRPSTRRRGATARVELTPRRIPALPRAALGRTRGRRTPSRIMRRMTRYTLKSRARSAPLHGGRRAHAPCIVAALSLAAATRGALAQSPGSSDWGYYGGDELGQHF